MGYQYNKVDQLPYEVLKFQVKEPLELIDSMYLGQQSNHQYEGIVTWYPLLMITRGMYKYSL